MSAGDAGCAIVVGASSGIGAALCVELAQQGYRVAAVARREDELKAVVARCDDVAGTSVARVYCHDVTSFDEVPALFGRIVGDLGGLDTIIYAAGYMPAMGADEYDFVKDRAILEVGLLGAVAWLNCAAEKFTRQRHGTICGISSIAGDRGRRPFPAYHTAKAALNTYLEALRNRLQHPHGVSVVTIKPGYIDTAMTQGMDGLFWVISPEKAARIIFGHIKRKRHTCYVPARWGLVGFVIRNIPSFIFRRMKI